VQCLEPRQPGRSQRQHQRPDVRPDQRRGRYAVNANGPAVPVLVGPLLSGEDMLDSAKRIILALCLTALSPWALFAPGENGTIVGTVVDASGAAVPGTTIGIKNNETGATITLTTSEAGQYTSPPLRPGSYTVSAEKQGFRRTLQTISLDVNQHARVNFDL